MTAATGAKVDSRNTSIRRVPRVSMTSGAVDGDLAVMSSEEVIPSSSPNGLHGQEGDPPNPTGTSTSPTAALAHLPGLDPSAFAASGMSAGRRSSNVTSGGVSRRRHRYDV